MQHLRFVPYQELGELPNVVVDGGPVASTRLTLSHWPGSPTPVELLDDLSAQIAFRALARPELFEGVSAVSNNHVDQDGLASAFTLLEPSAAVERRDRVIDIARAGDFATFEDRDSIRVAFALAALADPARSTLDPAVFAGSYDEQCAALYIELLGRFVELADDADATRRLWEAEDAHLDESIRAIERGVVGVEEDPALDLVVVTVPESWVDRMTTRFAINRADAVHPAAIHRASSCLRVALIQGRRYRVEMRYESWVMYRSRPVLPRPDLRVLAARLNEGAGGGSGWTADPPGALTPVLRSPESGEPLAPEGFRAQLEQFLRHAPAAWDPYQPR